MSSIFKPINRKNKIITCFEVFVQDITTDTMLQTFEQFHKILNIETVKAGPDKFFIFLRISQIFNISNT